MREKEELFKMDVVALTLLGTRFDLSRKVTLRFDFPESVVILLLPLLLTLYIVETVLLLLLSL